MTMSGTVALVAVVTFAAFFFGCGYFVGKRRTLSKVMPALLYAGKRATPADLSNTVARQPRRPD